MSSEDSFLKGGFLTYLCFVGTAPSLLRIVNKLGSELCVVFTLFLLHGLGSYFFYLEKAIYAVSCLACSFEFKVAASLLHCLAFFSK